MGKFNFNTAQMTKMQRSRFPLSQNIKTTFNVGRLIPFYTQEVLPGDTFKLDTSAILRTSTLLNPTMDNLIFDYYYFFVPNRIMWNEWKNLMGESVSAWIDEETYEVPHIDLVNDTYSDVGINCPIGAVCDYLGIPPEFDYSTANAAAEETLQINVLPIRAYEMIYNEWFRDQNLIDPLVINLDDTITNDLDVFMGDPFKVAKYHDYFTSLLPSTQKGTDVYLPLGDMFLPVLSLTTQHNNTPTDNEKGTADGAVVASASSGAPSNSANFTLASAVTTGYLDRVSNSPTIVGTPMTFNNLWATSAHSGAVTPNSTINALRLAFQIQKIYEKDARGGSRYVEILRSHFGVISPDARQQRPEFLGGGSQVLGVQQVPQTSVTTSGTGIIGVGNVGAFSFTGHSKYNFEKSFTEHGFIMGVCVVRYKNTYAQGIQRYFNRLDRFDYYDPSLAHIAEQPVYKTEIIAQQSDKITSNIFGYNEAWADYRYNPNRVSGLMRPYVTGNVATWHYADDYAAEVTLNQTFIEVDETNVDRSLIVASTVTHQIIADIFLNIMATRPMPLFSIPGMIDHF